MFIFFVYTKGRGIARRNELEKAAYLCKAKKRAVARQKISEKSARSQGKKQVKRLGRAKDLRPKVRTEIHPKNDTPSGENK